MATKSGDGARPGRQSVEETAAVAKCTEHYDAATIALAILADPLTWRQRDFLRNTCWEAESAPYEFFMAQPPLKGGDGTEDYWLVRISETKESRRLFYAETREAGKNACAIFVLTRVCPLAELFISGELSRDSLRHAIENRKAYPACVDE